MTPAETGIETGALQERPGRLAHPPPEDAMNASQLFKAGQLTEAIDAQIKEVKAQPLDQGKRLFLFELLAFAGEWDRARRQIEAVKYDDANLDTAVAAYRKLLDAEQARQELFQQGRTPKFLMPPPAHVQLRLQALGCLRQKQPAEAARLLAEAQAASPALAGQLNERPFQALRDCDDVFGPVLEVMAHGDYYWLPLEQLATLTATTPASPRDLLWFPARIEVRSGPAGDVFLPALYPGSHQHADASIKLGRQTDWSATDEGPVQGVGLRMFLVDDDAVSLLEWRSLTMS
jgi:type VI secretion system protein ImpE